MSKIIPLTLFQGASASKGQTYRPTDDWVLHLYKEIMDDRSVIARRGRASAVRKLEHLTDEPQKYARASVLLSATGRAHPGSGFTDAQLKRDDSPVWVRFSDAVRAMAEADPVTWRMVAQAAGMRAVPGHPGTYVPEAHTGRAGPPAVVVLALPWLTGEPFTPRSTKGNGRMEGFSGAYDRRNVKRKAA